MKKKPSRKRAARKPSARPKPKKVAVRKTANVDIVAQLKAIGASPDVDVNARIRALRAAGQLEAQLQAAARGAKPGKKEIAAEEAETAGRGTSWGNDLEFETAEPEKGKSLN